MRIGSFPATQRAELAQDLEEPFQENPEQAAAILDVLDKYGDTRDKALKALTTMAQRQISPQDNMNVEILEFSCRQDEAVRVALQRLRGKPLGAWPMFSSLGRFPSRFTFDILDLSDVQVTCGWDVNPTREVLMRVWVQGA